MGQTRVSDPPAMLKRLKERGLQICVWINPYIAQNSAMFDEGMANGYLVKLPNGDVWQWDRWQAGMGLVDFTNPAARQWFGDKLRALLDMGVDCFKTDFGERIPTGVVYSDGSDPREDAQLLHLPVQPDRFRGVGKQAWERKGGGVCPFGHGGGAAVPGALGRRQHCHLRIDGREPARRPVAGLSGFGFWSHDIGGFEQTASADVYKRWCAFGLLSSHSRLHGSSSYRVPWLFDEEAVDVLRFFTKLKCRLMPYLFAGAVEATTQGTPVMRAMLLEFPDDPACDTSTGSTCWAMRCWWRLFSRRMERSDYYLPAGRWTNYLTGQVLEGGRWVREHMTS